jgi:hypothetical protein
MRERICVRCENVLICQRTTRIYCSNACRQSVYRRRRSPRIWQRHAARSRRLHVIRPTVSLAQVVVRPMPLPEARPIIEQKEPMCGVATHAFGLFLGNALASVVVFGVHPAGNLSPRYDHNIALLRGVTQPWAPANCGSKLIRRAMDLLPESYRAVIAYADATLGERGAIYKAAGFSCVGAPKLAALGLKDVPAA